MEILEILVESFEPKSITDLSTSVRVKHQKAKSLLESMVNVEWIESITSMREDLRYKVLYKILPEGNNILKVYYERIEQLFNDLNISNE